MRYLKVMHAALCGRFAHDITNPSATTIEAPVEHEVMEYDIMIVGPGPAGLSAAIRVMGPPLSAAGNPTLLVVVSFFLDVIPSLAKSPTYCRSCRALSCHSECNEESHRVKCWW